MKISTGLFSRALPGAAVALTMLLAACGGGGSDAATAAAASTVPPPKFACVNVPGATDAAQSQITGTLVPQLGAIPQAGPIVQRLVLATAQLLDVADAVANGLQSMAATQDAMQLTATVEGAVAALRCAINPVSEGLAQIQSQLPVGTSIPNIASADALLVQIAAILDNRLATGPGAGLPTGFNLVNFGLWMNQLNAQLTSIASQLQTKLPANSPVTPVFTILNYALVDVALVLDRLAAVDGAGTANALTFLITDISTRMTAGLASALSVPSLSVLGLQLALNNALPTVANQVSGGIPTVLRTTILTLLGRVLGLAGAG